MLEFLLGIDIALFSRINQEWISPGLDPLMKLLSSVPLLWAILIMVVTGLVRRSWRISPGLFSRKCGLRKILVACLLMVCTAAVTDGVTHAAKHYYKRQRPYHVLAGARYPDGNQWVRRPIDAPVKDKPGSSFVSGHASNSMALAVTLAFVCPPLKPFIYALPLSVGYSRIYLGRHYPFDVVAGWLLGWLLSSCICRIFQGRVPIRKSSPHSPETPHSKIQPEKAVMEPITTVPALKPSVYAEKEDPPVLSAGIPGAAGMRSHPRQALYPVTKRR